ncbi:MAG: InlB B-repeat-containing protein [Oscillospiraceae bacterium]|nr:InlB B-repeat-containing protein [Oscillospiraceae bacterium]
MRKRKTVRTIIVKATTWLLTACMLAGLSGFAACAEGADQDTPLVVSERQGEVEVGNITINTDDDVTGVEVTSTSGTGAGGTQVTTGDVSVTLDSEGIWYSGCGVEVYEGANASNTMDMGSIDVTVTVSDDSAEAFGIVVYSKGSDHETTINTESIQVTGNGDDYSNAVGLDLYSSNSVSGSNNSLEINIDGNLTVHDELTTAQGVRLYNDEGANNSVRITVNGNVTATMNTEDSGELAEGMALTTGGSGNKTEVVVDGDMTADRRGLGVDTEEGGSTDVVVTGTISGTYVGIGFGDDFDVDNTSVTTWKIESDGVLVDTLYDYMSPEEITAIAEKFIHYIVKLAQPEQGDILQAVKADGSALDTKTYKVSEDEGEKTVSTQTEGKIVRLKLNSDKYEIVSAENVDGTPLSKDDQGYYYSVTRGGGILLSAILKEKKPPEPPTPPDPPKPQPSGGSVLAAGGDAVSWIKVSYELDGGVYKEDPGPIVRYCTPGQLIYLLDAPEKEGYEFGGWYREINGKPEIRSAGESFQTWTSVNFTAIWNEA